ncbi:MAG: NAD(+) synthase [Bradymonadia bacterium]
MKLIRVAAGALNQTPLDWAGNRRRILDLIAEARTAGATVLCLPELCITGYGCEDAFQAPHVTEKAWQILLEVAAHSTDMVVSLGLPVLFNNVLYNCAALLVNGQVVGLVAKQYLAGDGIHYEPRWFKAWEMGEVLTYRGAGPDGPLEVPIGDLHFEVGGVRMGFEICEDAWVAQRPGSVLARRGVDIILNPSASHFAFDKWRLRERLVLEGARAFGVTYVYANLLGNESGRAIYDGGTLIACGSQMLARGGRLTLAPSTLIHAMIDVQHTRMLQARTVSLKPDLAYIERDDRVRVPFEWPAHEPANEQPNLEPWVRGRLDEPEDVKCEEFTRAEALGLFDYLRKSRSRGFVVSLSGGADSAACAALVGVMVRLALAHPAHMRDALGYIPAVAKLLDGVESVDFAGDPWGHPLAQQLTQALLVTAYQGTRNSSDVTRNAAADVASAVGATHHDLDVDGLVELYRGITEKALGRPLTWDQDDIALQNIQARVRGPSVWMLANIHGALLLSTSNRSEAAVGYATMDGDTCGGLSPIAGIDKDFLRVWLRWMEHNGPFGLAALSALNSINVQQPTAELRPQDQGQTDEDDLMPYDLLDDIERAAIRDKLSPLAVYRLMRVRFPQHSADDMLTWVERFFQLWCRNQWKRERYAPSFHLDDANLDPKTWCRFPILSGGYWEELAELRTYVRDKT